LYFLRKGYEVVAVDNDLSAVRTSNFISQSIQKAEVAQVANIEDLPFPDNHFDFIICSKVLHFANSQEAWNTMWKELERVLHPEGLLYCVVASILGIEGKCRSLDAGKYEMPNGCVRFALSMPLLDEISANWNHHVLPKTVIYGSEIAETTLLLRR
jgi:ubiquinone/menaquinone biosynthesis C-methylase UbiE